MLPCLQPIQQHQQHRLYKQNCSYQHNHAVRTTLTCPPAAPSQAAAASGLPQLRIPCAVLQIHLPQLNVAGHNKSRRMSVL